MVSFRRLITIIISAAFGLPIFATVPDLAEIENVILSPEVQEANLRKAAGSDSSFDASRTSYDYDCCYYWLGNDGSVSNTWETSITGMEADGNGGWLIKGLFADTFSFVSGGSRIEVDDIAAHYDGESGLFTIECGQHLFDYTTDKGVVPISLLAVRRGEKGWNISGEGTMTFVAGKRTLATAETSDVVGFFFGAITDAGKIQGFGAAIYPVFNEFNGVMIYSVTPDIETEAIPSLNDIYSEVVDGKLHITNFANFGYHVDVALDYSLSLNKAWATDALIDYLADIYGDATPFYAANALEGGEAQKDGNGSYYFSASVGKDMLGNTVLSVPSWGAYMEGSPLGMYSRTEIMLFYPLESSGVVSPAVSGDDAPVYYNLQGYRVDNPARGNLYIRRQGIRTDKIVF